MYVWDQCISIAVNGVVLPGGEEVEEFVISDCLGVVVVRISTAVVIRLIMYGTTCALNVRIVFWWLRFLYTREVLGSWYFANSANSANSLLDRLNQVNPSIFKNGVLFFHSG